MTRLRAIGAALALVLIVVAAPLALLVWGVPVTRVGNLLRPDDGSALLAVEQVGAAQHLLDLSVDYAKARLQFGRQIGSFQAIKHHCADALLKVEFAKPLVWRAAYSLAQGDPDAPLHASMAKAAASDAADVVGRIAMQCHGGIGYTVEYDLHLYLKRAWALVAQDGSAASHRRRVADAVLG